MEILLSVNGDENILDYDDLRDILCPFTSQNGSGNASRDCANLSSLFDYYSYDTSDFVETEKNAIAALFALIFLLGVAGHALIVYVLVKSGTAVTVTNIYLMSLCASDLMFLAFCVPFTGAMYLLPSWPFGVVMCKCVNYLMMVSMATCIFTMTAMSVDRYFAVVHPVKSKAFRIPRNTLIVVVCVWVSNLLVLTPVALLSRLVEYWDNGGNQLFCTVYFKDGFGRQAYTLSVFLCYYVAPLIVIVLCYSLMTNSLWRSVSPRFLQQNFARAMKFRRRVAKTVMATVVVFAVCWLPIHCVHLRDDFTSGHHYPNVSYVAKIIAHCMSYASSAFNPVIYAFMSDNFRQSFRVVFGKRKVNVVRLQGVNRPKPAPRVSLMSPKRRQTGVGVCTNVCTKLQAETRNLNLVEVHVTEAIPLSRVGHSVLQPCPERV